MKILTGAQMRDVDRRTTEEFGVPSRTRMENAGAAVVSFLAREIAPEWSRARVAILCGKGNNGGDGLVVARLLRARGCNPQVYLFAEPHDVKGDAAVNLARWSDCGGALRSVTAAEGWESIRHELAAAEVLVDALLGTGLRGPVEGLLAGVINDVNRICSNAHVVAVDIPSGLPSDGGKVTGPFVRAESTVTFTAPKLGHILPDSTEHIGTLHVAAIGTPPELLERDASLRLHWIEPAEFRSLPLQRSPASHKGSFGHALIVAGSRGKTGAAVLAGGGSLRSGAGLTTVATPATVQFVVSAGFADLMTEGLLATDTDSIAASNLDYGRLDVLWAGKSVVAIGPGLSQHEETKRVVRHVVSVSEIPLIVDADGLNAFSGNADLLRARKARHLALTPHPGEMARLLGISSEHVQSDRLSVALRAANSWNAYVVLKGHRTIVATPDGRVFVNTTGNPGMATGGTGDVLTGILAGLTSQLGTAQWERVLSLGVYLHGLAGDIAAAEKGQHSLIASDLLDALPSAFRLSMKAIGE